MAKENLDSEVLDEAFRLFQSMTIQEIEAHLVGDPEYAAGLASSIDRAEDIGYDHLPKLAFLKEVRSVYMPKPKNPLNND